MRKFVTIIPHGRNFELRKDPGQIPYHLHRLFGYDSYLVTYYYSQKEQLSKPLNRPPLDSGFIDNDYPYIKSEVPGLKVIFLQNLGRGKFYEKAVLKYLKSNARSIDILNLFHFNTDTILYTFIYKFLNPKGKVYIKLDINIEYYKSRDSFFNFTRRIPFLKNIIEVFLTRLFFRKIYLVSAESNAGLSYFIQRFGLLKDKAMVLPNGIDKDRINSLVGRIKKYHERENIIITIGRIGTSAKNTQQLLKAIPQLKLDNWKVYLIGSIDPSFKIIIDEFFTKYPNYKDQVIFTGQLNNPATLYDFYNRAKIFCMTSVNEGFPLSGAEAAYFGNYMVLTDTIYAFKELSNNGEYGSVVHVHDHGELAKTLQKLIDNDEILHIGHEQMKKYALENLTWQAIMPKLNDRLNKNI